MTRRYSRFRCVVGVEGVEDDGKEEHLRKRKCVQEDDEGYGYDGDDMGKVARACEARHCGRSAQTEEAHDGDLPEERRANVERTMVTLRNAFISIRFSMSFRPSFKDSRRFSSCAQ